MVAKPVLPRRRPADRTAGVRGVAARGWNMRLTAEEILRQGLQALREKLGRAGMIRFLQQFERGSGDYAKKRHAWVDRTSLNDLRAMADLKASRRSRRPR